MYGLTLASAPASEPVTLAELKSWLRVETTADDSDITALGLAARRLVESYLGRQLVTATWRLTLDGFPWPGGWAYLEAPTLFPDPHTIRIPKAPLQSVSTVEYYDLGGTLNTLDAATYNVDAASDPGRIILAMGKVWPVTKLMPAAVQITFVAGYGAAASVPEEVKLAIKMLAAHWYERRGDDGTQEELPLAVKSLLGLNWNGEREYGL